MRKIFAELKHARRRLAVDAAILEDRVLFSAVPLMDVAAQLDSASLSNEAPAQTAMAYAAPADPQASTAMEANGGAFRFHGSANEDQPAQPGRHDDQSARLEVVFVDEGAEGYQQLVDEILLNGDPARELEVYLLDPHRDGIEQISEILKGFSGLDAVHIVSHASAGLVKIGSTWLGGDSLSGYASDVAGWHSALRTGADLLFYGCDLGASEQGRLLIDALAALTGADVAASTGETGHASLGGDWILEYTAGTIDTSIVLDQDAQNRWQGLLATFTVTNTNNAGAGSLRQAILNANANPGLDTLTFKIPVNDPRHYYYQNDAIAGSLSRIATTSLPDGSIGDFDPDYPYAQHTWFRIDLAAADIDLVVTDAVIIDGYSQSGASQNTLVVGNNAKLMIELTSSGMDADRGLTFDLGSGGSTVRGLDINGFDYSGIMVEPGANAVTIQGNFLGTDITGTRDLGNLDAGIQLRSSNNLVGGADPADRNVVSGNQGRGIVTYTTGPLATGNIFRNNYVGVDATGVKGLGNDTAGIQVYNQSGIQIRDNVIADHSTHGIWFRAGSTATGAVVQGNLIGVGADGLAQLGNDGAGILIESTATNNSIGGTSAGQGNTIAFNVGDGIAVTSGTGNAILGNRINSNGGLAIDLKNDGVTPNDNGDGDSNANRLQNFPVLTSAMATSSQLTLVGSLNSVSSGSGRTYRIEFFANAVGDPTGYGEGERYLGSTTVTTNGSGNGSFNVVLNESVLPGEFISATATDLTTYDTSEFALNRIVLDASPKLALPGGPANYTLGDPLAMIDGTATVSDLDSANFDTGTLTVSIGTGALTDDRLEILDGGVIRLTGNTVEWKSGGPTIAMGKFSGGVGLAPLVVTLNANATPDRTQDLVRAIGYRNVSVSAPTYSVKAQFVLTDGDGGTSSTQLKTISVLGANQAPVNSVPGPQSTAINTPLTFSTADGNLISTLDPDAGAAVIQTTLSATNGSLTLNLEGGLATAVGNEVLTNSTTTNTQSEPSVARAPGGNYVVVWSGYRNAPNPTEILFQLYDANGSPIGGQTIANSTTANIQSQPAVAMDANGNFVIIWTSLGQDHPDLKSGIYGQRFDATGTAVGGEFLINTVTAENQHSPAVARDANGDFVVVWIDKFLDGGNEGVFGQRFSATAAKVGGQFQVNTTTFGKQDHADVAIDAAGNFVVVWDSAGQDFTDGQSGVYARRYDLNGMALSGEVLVNTTVPKEQDYPSIAMNGLGNYVIVWTSKEQDGSGRGVFGQLFDAAGNRVGPTEFQVNSTTNLDQMTASVTMDAGGNFAVVWESVNQDAPGDSLKGVYLQQFSKNGTPIGAMRLVNTTTAGSQDFPVVAMDADGDIVVAWHGNGTGDANGIFQRRFQNSTELSFSSGDGVMDTTMTVTASVTDLNAALDGMVFIPNTGFTGLATVTINVNDLGNSGSGGARSDSDVVNINVTGNSSPTITSNGGGSSASVLVAENSTFVTAVSATDADVPAQTLSYSIFGGADAGQFTINASTGVLNFLSAPDFESPTDVDGNKIYEVTVRVSDGTGGIDTQSISVAVTGVNDHSPVFTSSASVNVFENSTPVVLLAATDADLPSQPTTFSITGGADGTKFIVIGGNQLSFVAPPDFETPADADANNLYEVIVTASDGNGGSTDQWHQIRVTDVSGALIVDTTNDVVDGNVASVEWLFSNRGADGKISLREAILAANTTAEADTIVLGSGLHELTTGGSDGDLDVTGELTIRGVGASSTIIEARNGDRVFDLLGGSRVTLEDLTVQGGSADSGWGGGINLGDGSNVTLNRIVVTGNSGDSGSGIYSYKSTLVINDSTISNNNGKWGGGLYNDGGSTTLNRVTVSGNSASDEGAGIYNVTLGSMLFVNNSTVSGNTTPEDGAGVYNERLASISSSTIAYNSADSGGGVYTANLGVTYLYNSIVAANIGGNANAAVASLGNNIDDGTTLGLTQSGDLSSTNPLLGSLQNNGGYTATHALLPGSLAVSAANPLGVPATDQRGITRDTLPDIGAVEFLGGNGVPTFTSAAYPTVVEFQTTVVTLTASDPEMDPVSFTITGGADDARFTINGSNQLLFVAPPDYDSAADFNANNVYEVEVTASDGNGGMAVQSIQVTVSPVNNRAPAANADSYSIDEDGNLVVVASGVLDNDSDPEGGALTAILVNGPSHGQLWLDSDGSFTYVPTANFFGSDSFVYRAGDQVTTSNLATVAITVAPVNDRPIAADDSYVATEGTPLAIAAPGLLANDTDVENSPLTAILVSGPANGSISISADGSFTYTPNLDYNGADSFSYQAHDGLTASDVATVKVFVTPVNNAPIGNGDHYAVDEDGILNIPVVNGVLANDRDPDDDPLTVALASGPAHASLFTLQSDGSFVYQPIANLHASDSFTYRLNDGTVNSDPVTVVINVAAVNDAPIATGENFTTRGGQPLFIPSLAMLASNDSDVDGDVLTAVLVQGPTNGRLVSNPDGTMIYTSYVTFVGVDTLVYQVSDGKGGTADATVTIRVSPSLGSKTSLTESTNAPPAQSTLPIEPTADSNAPAPDRFGATNPLASSPVAGQAQKPVKPMLAGTDRELVDVLPAATTTPQAVGASDTATTETQAMVPYKPSASIVRMVRSVLPTGMVEAVQHFVAAYDDGLLWNDLGDLRNELQVNSQLAYVAAGTVTSVTSSLSVGYVLWMVRSGWLVTSVLAQMPAWRLIDPMVVLDYLDEEDNSKGRGRTNDDDDSLESMLEKKPLAKTSDTELTDQVPTPVSD